MKKGHLLFWGLVLTFQCLNAQTVDSKFALGLNLTKSEYHGDIGNGLWDFNQNFLGGGLSLGRYLNASFDMGLQGNFGQYGYRKDAIDNFYGYKMDFSLYGHYKLNNGYILKKEAKLSPFLSIGAGLVSYFRSESWPDPKIITGNDFIFPVGAGLKYQFNDFIALQYSYLYNFTTSDIRDETSIGHNSPNVEAVRNLVPIYLSSKGNDAFGEHLLSVIFTFGKPKDTDGDGVPDKYDHCQGTSRGLVVDASGCPVDTDGDGVPDYLDKCSGTPANVNVDASGCPADADKDGVPDYIDKCPNTPAKATVDASGCPTDADKDGVPDYLDKCPNTPANISVDATGCPIDTDKDGVPDYIDKCPSTPKSVKVDANGCPTDTDKDGVPDYLDKCPNVAGLASNKGCPEIKAEAKKIFTQALQGVQFESGKDLLKKTSYPILDKVVTVLKDNPSYNLEINGHTDSQGDDAINLDLSQKRADAVKNYIVKKGIDEARLITKGYGETMPVADNATAAGRAKNRRVEFKVNF